jgi:ribosomal protein S24E
MFQNLPAQEKKPKPMLKWWWKANSGVFWPIRDILHPGRANISKDELSEKLGAMYKATKEQISVFGLRTQFGGGKTTGFALVYDSPEAMKKFEPRYRLIRVGLATKVERASRQQRTYITVINMPFDFFMCSIRILALQGFDSSDVD